MPRSEPQTRLSRDADPRIKPWPADAVLLFKSRTTTSPFAESLTRLIHEVADAESFESTGEAPAEDRYLGSDLFAPGSLLAPGLPILPFVDLRDVPRRHQLRVEVDGAGDNPLADACRKMNLVLYALRDIGMLADWDPNHPGSQTCPYGFFSTGNRSIYLIARRFSREARTDWIGALREFADEVNGRLGGGIIDTNIYMSPKAPGRGLYTRHETAHTFFNEIPAAWVLDGDVGRIRGACSTPATKDWVRGHLGFCGLMEGGNDVSEDTERIYARLVQFANRARFRSEVMAEMRLPPLPKRAGSGRPDYLAILQKHSKIDVQKRLSKGAAVLTRCPMCGKEDGHAMLTSAGHLKCFAGSCNAADDGLRPLGEDGWMVRLGIPPEEAEVAADDSDDSLAGGADPYPGAPPPAPRIPLSSARAAIENTILDALGRDEPQTLLLNMTPGCGKSQAAPSAVWRLLTEKYTGRNAAVLMLSPTRERTREWADLASGQGINAFAVYGRDESNCQRDEDCRAAARAGFEGNIVCRTCRFAPRRARRRDTMPEPPSRLCAYQSALYSAVHSRGNRLIFAAYESVVHLLQRLRRAGVTVPAVVFDEDPERLFRETVVLGLDRPGAPLPAWADRVSGGLSVRQLLQILRAAGREVADVGDNAAAGGPVLLKRLEELAQGMGEHVRLKHLVCKRSQETIAEIVKTARRRASRGTGIRDADGSVLRSPPACLPEMIAVLRGELKKREDGVAGRNTRLRLGVDSNGRPELRLQRRRMLQFPGHVIVLDGTGDAARLQAALPDRTVREVRIDVEMPGFNTVHLIRNANRQVAANPERRARLLADVEQAAKAFVRPGSRVLVVGTGRADDTAWEERLARAVRGSGGFAEVGHGHYQALRGTNRFEDFDAVITVGDNEPAPHALRDEVAAVYAAEAAQLNLAAEPFGLTWQYTDERLRPWHDRATTDEVAQAALRVRPCSNPGRVHVHVGLRYPVKHLGRPGVSVSAVQVKPHIARSSMAAFFNRHGWLCRDLLVAVGYLEESWDATPDAEFRAWLRDRFGNEFTPLAGEPYAERQLRTLRDEALEEASVFRFAGLEWGGRSIRVTGWGDRKAFMKEISQEAAGARKL